MAQSRLDILVNAKNNASPTLKQVGSDLAGIDKFAGNAAKGLGGLAVAGGVAGLVALGTAAAGAVMELGRVSATAQDVEASFNTMAAQGGNVAASMLDGLREASRGAISDSALMLTANKGMLLGVAQNTEDFVALMDVARARSQAMGITTAQAFGDITTGIARGSALILDNLGIVVDTAKANEVYAQSIGTVASKLTDQEKKQALVNAVIRDSADLVAANVAAGDDAASNFERMEAAIDNAKVALGDLFQPATVAVSQAIAAAAVAASEGMKEMGEAGELSQFAFDAENAAAKIAFLNTSLADNKALLAQMREEGMAASDNYDNLRTSVDELEAELAATKQAQLEYNRALIASEASIGEFNHAQMEANLSLQNMNAASMVASAGLGQVGFSADAAKERLAALKAQSDETAAALTNMQNRALGALESAATSAVGIMGASQVAGIYGPAKEQLDAQIKALQQYGGDADWVKFKIEELAERAAAPFNNAVEASREADKAAKSYAKTLSGGVSDAAKEAERAFEGLRSKVAGVLSQALDPGVGVDPDELLANMGIPRPDDINENARRLADIAKNGLMGQDWLGAFKNEVPDIWNMLRHASNPQEEAAHLLRDFQDGLLSSAIDKGKAKELVRRMLMGEANMAELALEIAGELAAEMGVPLQQALGAAQGALGVGGMSQTGTDAATEFGLGARDAATTSTASGAAMMDGFIESARSKMAALRTAGMEAGRAYGAGFIEAFGGSVPGSVLEILSTLVTPLVQGKLAQQASLTNAAP